MPRFLRLNYLQLSSIIKLTEYGTELSVTMLSALHIPVEEWIFVAELSDLFNEFMTEVFDLKVFCGIVTAIIVCVFEIRLTRNLRLKNWRVEKAIRLGHIVKAKRLKTWDDDNTGCDVNSWFHGTYGYEVDGKSYKYRYMGKVSPPYELTLYYIRNPRKTFRNETKSKEHTLALLGLFLPIAAGILVVFLLGGI